MTMGDPGIRKSFQKVIWNIDPTGALSSSFLLEYDFSDDEVEFSGDETDVSEYETDDEETDDDEVNDVDYEYNEA